MNRKKDKLDGFRPSLVVALCCLALFFTACTTVATRTPVSGTVPSLDKDKINGVWAGSGGVIAMRLKDASAGTLEVVNISVNADKIELVHLDGIVRETPAGIVVSLQTPAQPGWLFGRISLHQDSLAIFAPDPNFIGGLVRDGRLAGHFVTDSNGKQSKDVLLDQLGAGEFQRLQSLGFQPMQLFSQDPIVLLRAK